MTEVKVLTPIGNKEFIDFIINLKKDDSIPIPSHILDQLPFTEVFRPEINIENKQFATRFEFGAYLHSIFKDYPRDTLVKNEGLWNWLSLFYVDQLIPENVRGKKIVGEISRYAYNSHYTSFYRHLVAGSWDIYSRYGEDSKLFLYTPMNKTSQLILDLACRQNIISNRNLIKVVQILYWQNEGNGLGAIKRGAVTKTKPGSLARLIAILNQLDTTYDFYGMNPEDILTLLPAEFDLWKNKVKRKPVENHEKQPMLDRHFLIQKTLHQEYKIEEIPQSVRIKQHKKIHEPVKKLAIEADTWHEISPKKPAVAQLVRKPEVEPAIKVAIKGAMKPLELSSKKLVKRPVIEPTIPQHDESIAIDTPQILEDPKRLEKKDEMQVHDTLVETPPYCQNCGKKVPHASRFCPFCGSKLGIHPVSSPASVPERPSKKNKIGNDVPVQKKKGLR
jgi:hypothetical protein